MIFTVAHEMLMDCRARQAESLVNFFVGACPFKRNLQDKSNSYRWRRHLLTCKPTRGYHSWAPSVNELLCPPSGIACPFILLGRAFSSEASFVLRAPANPAPKKTLYHDIVAYLLFDVDSQISRMARYAWAIK